MTITATPDSQARLVSRGTFELAHYRAITADDAKHATLLAIRSANASEMTVVRLEWEVDGLGVDSPIGEFGSRVTATLELLV